MAMAFDVTRTPCYLWADAARLVDVAPATLARWTAGAVPLVATAPRVVEGHRYLAFLALAECWGVQALRRSGWTPARIAAAVAPLRRAGGPVATCASQAFLGRVFDPSALPLQWDADPDCPAALLLPLGPTIARLDPRQCFGRPHIAGVPVDALWERIGAGETCAAVAADYAVPRAVVENVAAHWHGGAPHCAFRRSRAGS